MVEFDLGAVEGGQKKCNFGSHAEEELAMPRNMDCEWERHVVSHVPFWDWCRLRVAGEGS